MRLSLIYIKGGLGNQLFQFAFANYIKSKRHKIIFCDEIFRDPKPENITKRDVIFPIKSFGFSSSNFYTEWLFNSVNKIFQSRTAKKIFKPKNNYVFNYIKDSDLDNFNKKSFLTIYDGYWQELDFIIESKNYLIESIKDNKLISNALKIDRPSGSTMVHIRRGDYLDLNQELNDNYYIQSINKLNKNVKNFNFDIYTDDISWVKSNSIFDNASNIFSPKSAHEDRDQVIKIFSQMLSYENYIIANSSFSYMAAFLGSLENSKVLYPDPWFLNKNKNVSVKKSWIPINSK